MTSTLKYCFLGFLFVGCAAATSSSSSNTGTTTTTFQNPTNLQIAAPTGFANPSQLIIADFNGDNYPDIVSLSSNGTFLYLNQAGSSWTKSTISVTTDFHPGVAAGTDLLLFFSGTNLQLFVNNGSGTFASTSTLSGPSTTLPALMAFARSKSSATSGFAFVPAGSSGSHFIAQRVGSGSGALSAYSPSPDTTTIPAGSALKALSGDIDGDGYIDFALIPSATNTLIQFFRNADDASFSATATGSITRNPATASITDAQLVDLDSDGKMDLLLTTSAGLEFYKGAGNFSGFTATSTGVSTVGSSLVAADFTGDGKVDIFVSRSGSSSVFLSQTGSLTFSDITSTAFSGLLSSGTSKVYAADIDANGSSDIIELKTDGSIAVHINNYKK